MTIDRKIWGDKMVKISTMKNMRSKFAFLSLFFLIGLIALQIPFTRLLGGNVKFTLYDFLAPTAGAFLATLPGIMTVLLIQLVNFLIHPDSFTGFASLIRIFPVLFAVFYFAKNRKYNLLIPVLSILIFNLHPIGRSAWQYSLLWLIPIAAHFYRKNLFLRSLGATFSAHAVGGALWVWAFGLSKELWLALIPQTLMERTLMAGGISLSYFALKRLIRFMQAKKVIILPVFS